MFFLLNGWFNQPTRLLGIEQNLDISLPTSHQSLGSSVWSLHLEFEPDFQPDGDYVSTWKMEANDDSGFKIYDYAQNYVALIPLNLSGLPNVFLVILEVEKQQNIPLNHEKHRVRFYIIHPTSTFWHI